MSTEEKIIYLTFRLNCEVPMIAQLLDIDIEFVKQVLYLENNEIERQKKRENKDGKLIQSTKYKNPELL